MKYWLAIGLLLLPAWADAGTHVQVEGHGSTVDLARQNGFRNAIEQVVGQVIISDQEVRGDRLTKDFIGGYSAGYVDHYEILGTQEADGQIILKMDVTVASSKIAQRMLSSGNRSLIVAGQQLQAQIETQLDQRARGDRLITEVLNSYPYNAYIVNSGQTEVSIGRYRQAYIDVPYEIHWNKQWLEAFNELLNVVAVDSKNCNSFFIKYDNKIRVASSPGLVTKLIDTPCGQEADLRMNYKSNGSWLADVHSYYSADRQTVTMINDQLRTEGQQHIGLRINLLDAGGDIVDSRCARINAESFIAYAEPTNEVISWSQRERNFKVMINGRASVYGVLRINMRNTEPIGDIAKINLTVEKTCT